MNAFIVTFLCIQACLVQNVFGQYTSRAAVAAEPGLIAPGYVTYDGLPGWGGIAPAAAPFGYGAGLAAELAYPAAAGLAAPFGALSPYSIADSRGVAGPLGYRAGLPELAYSAVGLPAPYGGIGEGNVAVAGELPVVGNTAVVGQVPIMGAVNFGGPVPAGGSVSINGQCSCGCGVPYEYLY